MGAELRWGERTYLMGIINVTPDSFSGDGLATGGRGPAEVVAAALAQGRAMVDAGADILDVGAESTRPRQAYGEHPEVSAEEEAALAIPVVRALASDLGDRAAISIDTSKGVVAAAALAAGAHAVIGAHPHVLQPIVRSAPRRLVAYSLGNFVFGASSPATASTGILRLRLSKGGVEGHRLVPAVIENGRPRLTR